MAQANHQKMKNINDSIHSPIQHLQIDEYKITLRALHCQAYSSLGNFSGYYANFSDEVFREVSVV